MDDIDDLEYVGFWLRTWATGSVRIFVCGALETFPWRRSPPNVQGKSVRRGGKVGAHFIRSSL